MTTSLVDAYIAAQPEPQRSMLEQARTVILEVIPQAEQVISYAMPAFKIDEGIVAFIAATKGGISYYPHSGQVLGLAGDILDGYSRTKAALHIPIGTELPRNIVERLIQLKLELVRA
jgi:uncharacterized protein YdhG (YjbR/CyaY superfamily)